MTSGKQNKKARNANINTIEEHDILHRMGLPPMEPLRDAGLPMEANQLRQPAEEQQGTGEVETGEGAQEVGTEAAGEQQQGEGKNGPSEDVAMEEGEFEQALLREGEGLVCLTQEELAEIHAAIRRIEEGQQAIMDSVQGVAQRQESVMRYMASSDHEAEVKMNAMRADLKRVCDRICEDSDGPSCSKWSAPSNRTFRTPNKDNRTPAKRRMVSSERPSLPICVFCESTDHLYHDQCWRVNRVGKRVAILRKKGLCIVCLAKAHPPPCRSMFGTARRCHHCSVEGSHHSSVCPSDLHRDRLDELTEDKPKKDDDAAEEPDE